MRDGKIRLFFYLDLIFIKHLDFTSVIGHLALVLVPEVLQSLLELGFVLLGQLSIDLADFDLAASAGFGELLLVDLQQQKNCLRLLKLCVMALSSYLLLFTKKYSL